VSPDSPSGRDGPLRSSHQESLRDFLEDDFSVCITVRSSAVRTVHILAAKSESHGALARWGVAFQLVGSEHF